MASTKRDGRFAVHRQVEPRPCGDPEQHLTMTEQTGLIGGDGEGRDVVQRRYQRHDRPIE